ncbi:Nn.00g034950.m01.CDS01 [Neocucurbitaria sp. VM-36]
MQAETSVFDPKLEKDIQEILNICNTNMASISIRSLRGSANGVQTEHQLRTMLRSTEARRTYTVSSDGEEIFHIASLTKVLVAVAVVIAVEVKANEVVPDNPYSKFKDIQNEPLTKLYNRYGPATTGGLPGNPTIYNLIVHNKGLFSANHRLLAPDGTPLMTLGDVLEDLIRPISHSTAHIDSNESWTRYSNTNYSVIAMTIEALWGRSLDTFMNETLFEPLRMRSTSIGFPLDRAREINGWVVDADDTAYEIARPRYQASGAEAGSLGAYSTARDLDTFYKFLLESFHGREIIKGFDIDVVCQCLQMENKETDLILYTPCGLYATLDSSIIGSMSSNRLQFPKKSFSTYPVLSGPQEEDIAAFHMAGSAIGCSCATAFLPSVTKENFAVVVLTNTSGPVDSADHLLRLILRKIVQLQYPKSISRILQRPKDIIDMVKQAKIQTSQMWEQTMQMDEERRNKAPQVSRDIIGVFEGEGFSQRLNIFKGDDGKTYITVGGRSTSHTSKAFELIWLDESSFKMCVPSHLSIDCLGNADWSNLMFKIIGQDRLVQRLAREINKKEDLDKKEGFEKKEDHFVRTVLVSA